MSRTAAVAVLALSSLGIMPATPAAAAGPVGHAELVPDTPRTDTPRIANGSIQDIVQWGDRVVLVGSFTRISNAGGPDIDQPYIAAYDIDTGQLDLSFRPDVDRWISTAAVSADGSQLYIGGSFNNVGGVTRRKLALLNQDGSIDTGFRANSNSRVTSVVVSSDGDDVYAGGFFKTINGVDRRLIARLDAATGDVDPAFDLPITEGIGPNGLLKVQQLMITPDDSRLVVVHTGNRVDGLLRESVAVIDTVANEVAPWQTDMWTDNLPRVGGVTRVVAADISPDGSYFVVTSAGGGDRPPINDTAVAFPVDGGAGVEPIWVSRVFDSVFSVAVTETAVYLGGHFRWLEAPGAPDPWPGDDDVNYGFDSGIGAAALGGAVVRREQIGAIDPVTGQAMPWNPGSNARVGIQVMTAVPRGLLLYQDGTYLGGENVGAHGFFDFESVVDTGLPETTLVDPWPGEALDGQPFIMTGAASADAGVQRVDINVRNDDTGEYLQDDLVSWAPTENSFDASTLQHPGATWTVWTQNLEGWDSGQYRIRATTYATDGTSDPSVAESTITVDASGDQPPSTEFTFPTLLGPAPETNAFTMEGRAADDVGVQSVRIVVRDEATFRYLQPNGTFGDAYVSVPAIVDNPGALTTTWHLDLSVPNGTYRATAAATDTAGQTDNGFRITYFTIQPDNDPPEMTITFPPPYYPLVADTSMLLTGTATDDSAVVRVELIVQNLQTTLGIQSNGNYGVLPLFYDYVDAVLAGPPNDRTWSLQTPDLPPGMYIVTGWAIDDLGARTAELPQTILISMVPGDAQPDTTFDQAGYDQDRESLDVELSGTAVDDNAVERVAITIQETVAVDFIQGRRYVRPDGGFAGSYTEIDAVLTGPANAPSWSLSGLTLPEPGDYTITVKAVDGSEQYDIDQTAATARWIVVPGDPDPYTWIQGPNEGDNPAAGALILTGRAFDDLDPFCSPGFTCGVDQVDVQIVNSLGQYLDDTGAFSPFETWLPVYLTNPGGQFSNWSYTTTPLPDDDYTVRARATDLAGQIDQTINTFPAAAGQEPDFINITVGSGPAVSPALSLVASVDPVTFGGPGEELVFSYELTNSGDVALDGPFSVVSDLGAVTCPVISSLDVGVSTTCSHTVTTDGDDVTAGSVTSVAAATASYSGSPIESNGSQVNATYVAPPAPALSLDVSVDPVTFGGPDEDLVFSYELTNSGDVALDGPFSVVSDLGAVTCPVISSLDVGVSMTCSHTVTTDGDDVTAGSVTSTATGSATYDGSPIDSAASQATSTLFVAAPALSLDVSVDPVTFGGPGEELVFSYELTNSGDVALDGPFSVVSDLGAVTCPVISSLDVGVSMTCSHTVTTDGDDVTAGSVTSTATGSATYDGSPIESGQASETATFVEVVAPALSIDVSVDPVTFGGSDEDLVFSYALTNSGDVALDGPFSVVSDLGAVTCPVISSLDVGVSTTCSHTVTTDGDDVTAGSVTSTATGSATYDGSPIDSAASQATATYVAPPAPALSLEASVVALTFSGADEGLTFSYLLTNTGDVALDGPFTVSDSFGGAVCPDDATLAVGASIVCSTTHVTTPGDVTAGSVTSTATASASYDGSTVNSNGSQATSTYVAPPAPALSLEASVDPMTFGGSDEDLVFSYELTNSGDVALDGPFTVS